MVRRASSDGTLIYPIIQFESKKLPTTRNVGLRSFVFDKSSNTVYIRNQNKYFWILELDLSPNATNPVKNENLYQTKPIGYTSSLYKLLLLRTGKLLEFYTQNGKNPTSKIFIWNAFQFSEESTKNYPYYTFTTFLLQGCKNIASILIDIHNLYTATGDIDDSNFLIRTKNT